MSLTIAIIGRPNVGKSTLFNRLVGKRLALVDDTPGVTRDRRQGLARLGGLEFAVIDTAGLDEAEAASLAGRMRQQTEAAIADADIVLFLIDARLGVTPLDMHFADLLRRTRKPILLVANKAEGKSGEAGYYEAFSLGFGEPVAISAEHGEGLADLLRGIEAVRAAAIAAGPGEAGEHVLPAEAAGEAPPRPVTIAIVGRPNVGKSTLVNRLIGTDRLLTGPEAGITRDAITIEWQWRDRPVRLVDTAGLRRKSRVREKLERLSVADTLRAIRFAEIVVLTLDATVALEKQDLHIADLVAGEGRAMVLAFDKWDLVEDRAATLRELRREAERLLPQWRGLPMVPVSGLSGEGMDELMAAIFAAHETWNRRIPTSPLNRWLADVLAHHPPPAIAGRRLRLRYITQVKSRPPTFIVFCSRPEAVPAAYRRYLVNGLRMTFDLPGVPIRLALRRGENPYERKSGKRR